MRSPEQIESRCKRLKLFSELLQLIVLVALLLFAASKCWTQYRAIKAGCPGGELVTNVNGPDYCK
jgi:hypothetical protein